MHETISVTVPGHSWITDARAPEIEGWRCCFVAHYGVERTVFTYRRAS